MISVSYIVLAICLTGMVSSQTGGNPTTSATTREATYCRSKPRSACFLGKCPSGFDCISGSCCSEADIVQPGGDCQDYLPDCSNVDCNAIGIQDFARANCARTCNLCYATGPISPQYACADILTDCRNRTNLCQDIDFIDMMALYCPRTCTLCIYNNPTKIPTCGDELGDCANRGNYCTSTGVSDYQKKVGCGKTCGLCENANTANPFSFIRSVIPGK